MYMIRNTFDTAVPGPLRRLRKGRLGILLDIWLVQIGMTPVIKEPVLWMYGLFLNSMARGWVFERVEKENTSFLSLTQNSFNVWVRNI